MWENSETLFQNAVDRSKDSEWTHWALGKALFLESDKNDEALAHLDQALELKPAYPRALFTKARLFKRTGNLNEAELCALQIKAQDPLYGPSNPLLGAIYLQGGKSD